MIIYAKQLPANLLKCNVRTQKGAFDGLILLVTDRRDVWSIQKGDKFRCGVKREFPGPRHPREATTADSVGISHKQA